MSSQSQNILLSRKDPALFSVTAQGGMVAAPPQSSALDYNFRRLGGRISRINSPSINNNLNMGNSTALKVENEKGELQVNPLEAVLPSEVEQQEITIFEADKQVHSERQISEARAPLFPLVQHTDSRTHTVVSFLQRPQLLAETRWDSSKARNASVFAVCDGSSPPKCTPIDFLVPEALLSTMLQSKLDGFTSFKATAVFRLQVQSQPFMQGRLMLAQVPMPELIGPRADWVLDHVSRAQVLNHVQMDISKETEVSLRIPFISPYNSYDLISSLWSWSRVRILVYSPYASAENQGVDVLLWAHFEDIELGAPTSGKVGQFIQDKTFGVAVQQSGVVDAINVGISNLPLPREVSAVTAFNAMNQEASGEVASYGAFGDAIRKLGGAAQKGWRELGNATGTSSVTNIFEGLSRAGTSIVSGIADIFGWSKPRVGYSGHSVMVRPGEYFGTTDGVDHSHVLALVNNNAIERIPSLGGTGADEMSFDFIKKIPTFIGSFKYTTGTKAGSVMWQSYVAPTYFQPQGDLRVFIDPKTTIKVGGNITVYQPINLHYAISCFEYWTGSLVYTFRFVKTDYHSGRIEIAFHPFTDEVDRSDYCYRTIIDLRNKTEVSVSVPYIAASPWKKVETGFDPNGTKTPWTDCANYATGKLTLKALTSLRANAIVSPNVEVLVEVRAGDDFRVSCPVKSAYLPVCVTPTAVAVQQSGLVHASEGNAETRTAAVEGFQAPSITGNDQDCHRPDVQTYCAGEVFTNYRALTRRFGFCDKLELDKTVVINPGDYTRSPIALYRILKNSPGNAGAVQFSSERYESPLSFVGAMYAFYQGAIRFKFHTSDPQELLGIRIDGKVATDEKAQEYCPSFMSPLGIEQPLQKKLAEVQVPYYGNTFMSSSWPHLTKIYEESPLGRVVVGRTLTTDKPIQVYVAVAASDDFDFKVYLGTPACFTRESLGTTSTIGEYSVRNFDNELWDVDPVSRVVLADNSKWQTLGSWMNVALTDLRQTLPADVSTVTLTKLRRDEKSGDSNFVKR